MSRALERRLGERDRKFFGLVARAAFANPFSKERAQLDAEIGETDASDPHVLARVSVRLSARLESLAETELTLAQFAAEDRELMFAALLFATFHRYIEQIDQLIEAPLRVRFARSLLSDLTARGFSPNEAQRAIELFYQMRRAHLAIGQRLTGSGPSMRKLREQLWNSVFTHDVLRYERYLWNRLEDFSILLIGETGTGKGQAARALGRSGYIPFDDKRLEFSTRVEDLFVPVNLSEFPETLLESELFGHRRGAFTGAIDHHTGALARVPPHGTLFIDEIGELSPAVQVKLLRVLQDREFTPVGAHQVERFHGRVVAATHRPLASLRSEGRMRDDFYYRVATQTIELPTLRTRLRECPGELTGLISAICARITGEAAPALAERVQASLEAELTPDYAYPGNVRELEQSVRRVLLTGSSQDQAGSASTEPSQTLTTRIERGELAAEELVRAYCELLYARSKSYVQVAKVTGLDRRTVRRHLTSSE
ncbi:MAG: sigma-54-dependent transcriptional regulator [Myxococcaceae bacterium]|nr:sigma-54-dependent transcriptional regulator [Myxococcaceae bacterium]